MLECGGLRILPAVKTPYLADKDSSFISKLISESLIDHVYCTSKDHWPFEEANIFSSRTDPNVPNLKVGARNSSSSGIVTIAVCNMPITKHMQDKKKMLKFREELVKAIVYKIDYHLYNEYLSHICKIVGSKVSMHDRIHYHLCYKNIFFDRFYLDEDFQRKRVYLKYAGYNILDISDEWIYIIPQKIADKYNLNQYDTYVLKYEFARYLVNILNNR